MRVPDIALSLKKHSRKLIIAGQAVIVSLSAMVITYTTGRYGFTPTDDEFILAGSERILHGEVPHRDIISARPMGSSLLHTVDLIPGPAFIAGRCLTAVELIVTALALLALSTRQWRDRRYRRSYVFLGAAGVTFLNLHIFPLTPWHTVDGAMLTAVGWYLMAPGQPFAGSARTRVGLFCCGYAAICKQSFAVAPVIALAILLWRYRGRIRAWRPFALDLLALASAPVLYFGWVAAAGGLPDAIAQLTASPPIWGQRVLVGTWHALRADAGRLVWVWAYVVGALLLPLVRRLGRPRWSAAVGLVIRLVMSLALVGVPLGYSIGVPWGNGAVPDFSGMRPDPSALTWWMLAVLVLVDLLVTRTVFLPAVLTLLLAWMISLSWGYDLPVLLGGSLTACALVMLWRSPAAMAIGPIRVSPGIFRAGLAGLTAVLSVLAVSVVLDLRSHFVYRDAQRSHLSADLGSVAERGRGIRTSPDDLAYLRQIKDCVVRYPADEVAVLPDNPGVYALLGLRNPFPADWLYGPELVADAKTRILSAARSLNKRGDFLVIFQTGAAGDPRAAGESIADYTPPLLSSIRGELSGNTVHCGSFVGVWRSAH